MSEGCSLRGDFPLLLGDFTALPFTIVLHQPEEKEDKPTRVHSWRSFLPWTFVDESEKLQSQKISKI